MNYTLLRWFEVVKRDLPWRETRDPYKIWVSEIILQQTRVAQGLDYYLRFIERFPNVRALAEASEDEVLRYWQGLGFYSRARNLHTAAQTIMTTYGGIFPREYAAVRSLKGIGDYTAAAICSFAYDDAYAVLDGNVTRVLARFFGESTPFDTPQGKRLFQSLATEWLNKDNPSAHNQALMELGALCCTPANPDCQSCPLQTACTAYADCRQTELPVRAKRIALKDRYFTYLIFLCSDSQDPETENRNAKPDSRDPKPEIQTVLYQRQSKDIWQHLYEFPLIESDHLLEPDELPASRASGIAELVSGIASRVSHLCDLNHTLTHQHLHARFYVVESNHRLPKLPNNLPLFLCSFADLDNYPLSRLTLKALEHINI